MSIVYVFKLGVVGNLGIEYLLVYFFVYTGDV